MKKRNGRETETNDENKANIENKSRIDWTWRYMLASLCKLIDANINSIYAYILTYMVFEDILFYYLCTHVVYSIR